MNVYREAGQAARTVATVLAAGGSAAALAYASEGAWRSAVVVLISGLGLACLALRLGRSTS